MPYILLLETSSPVCSVALSNGPDIIHCIESSEPNVHSSLLSVFIHKILQDSSITANQLSAVAVSNGPGSYTGLRIGLSTAKGICYGADLPLIALDSLQVMAAWFKKSSLTPIESNALLIPLIDARRQEVYAGYYNTEILPVKNPEAIILNEHSFEDFMQHHACLFIGNGAEKTKNILKNHYNSTFYPDFTTSANGMADIAWQMYQQQQFADVAYTEPFYLKEAYTTTPGKTIN
jgi:tRNA threonylcarbamoyladenosine biosynthesis protein TsaB